MTQTAFRTNTYPTPKMEVRSPLTGSEVYQMGIKMGQAVLALYTKLTDNSTNPDIRDMVAKLSHQEAKEIEVFRQEYKFALNCELDRFYNSGGTYLESDHNAKIITDSRPIIERNLDIFLDKMQALYQDGKVNSAEEIHSLAGQARTHIIELCQRLAQIYPAGDIQQALLEIASIKEESNLKID
ncbi:hypothetical protein [Syntrophomonas erecta]